jgi:pimeloyl-ACP methyl ester carboxylesterase
LRRVQCPWQVCVRATVRSFATACVAVPAVALLPVLGCASSTPAPTLAPKLEPVARADAAPTAPPVLEDAVEITRAGATVRGVLDRPPSAAPVPVFLLVAGSGPTDRDGNSFLGLRTDAYRQLARALAERGVATLRYDKRGIAASDHVPEADLTLGAFVEDARAFVARLRGDARFSRVLVAGHSEGGVIALELAQATPVDGLALVATPGRPLGAVLHDQLARRLPSDLAKEADRLLAAVRAGAPLERVPAPLAPLFHASIVPFLRSQLDLDPASLARSVQAPRVLVAQGDNDLQVTVDDARALAGANPRARLLVLPGVTHVLKDDAATAATQPSYVDPTRPLSAALVDAMVDLARDPK